MLPGAASCRHLLSPRFRYYLTGASARSGAGSPAWGHHPSRTPLAVAQQAAGQHRAPALSACREGSACSRCSRRAPAQPPASLLDGQQFRVVYILGRFFVGQRRRSLFSASSIRAHLLYGDRLDACLLWMRGSCMLRSNNLNMQGCMHTSFALMSCHASARAKHVQHRPPVADPGFLEWVFRVTNASDRCLSFACLI